ncbi:MAG: CRTAC1 family protein [Roseiflexaceae bacterium]
MLKRITHIMICTSLLLTACNGVQTVSNAPARAVSTTVQQTPLKPSVGCEQRFVRHELPHHTHSGDIGSYVYVSNGSGLAIGDLNGDLRDDIALGNLAGSVTILLNQGGLAFESIQTSLSDVRALSIVDTDGDGTNELVATKRFERPVIGQLDSQNQLQLRPMPNVYTAFYAMGWQDVNRDGYLDVVLGTYDTEQLQKQGLIFNQRGGGGVFVYTYDGQTYTGTRLNNGADALAIAFPDLNQDGLTDIHVGNDFNRADGIWLRQGDAWQKIAPFAQTTENTMGIDYADFDNNGRLDIFATDMKPYNQDVKTMAMWLPAMSKLTRPLSADDPQYPENTLYSWDGKRWVNRAYDLQVDATGWSWSGKFGDLNNDGWQELYVVNGMIAKDLLGHLDNAEIREANMLFHNIAGTKFTPVDWGLGDTSSGRSMSMADFDEDGDLDVIINPLDAPAVLFENRMCGGNATLITLNDPTSANHAAIGAIATVHVADLTMTRQVKSESGYLAGESRTLHYGVADAKVIDSINIIWPDGTQSMIEQLPVNHHITITKGQTNE